MPADPSRTYGRHRLAAPVFDEIEPTDRPRVLARGSRSQVSDGGTASDDGDLDLPIDEGEEPLSEPVTTLRAAPRPPPSLVGGRRVRNQRDR